MQIGEQVFLTFELKCLNVELVFFIAQPTMIGLNNV